MPLAIGLSMLVSAAIGGTPASAASASNAIVPTAANLPQAQTVEQYVSSYFADIPIMADIAQCESHFHQYNANGSIYRGQIDPQDMGVMQINTYYHGAEAKAMGIDLSTITGNVEFARYLYEKEGVAPWASSEKCWGSDLSKDAPSGSDSNALASK